MGARRHVCGTYSKIDRFRQFLGQIYLFLSCFLILIFAILIRGSVLCVFCFNSILGFLVLIFDF